MNTYNKLLKHRSGQKTASTGRANARRLAKRYVQKDTRMKRTLIIAALLSFVGVVEADVIIDVTKIAGGKESDVATYLGNPSSCGNSKYGKKCQYEKGDTEIVFIQGKADWITIEGIDHIPFSKTALGALGLKETRPTFSSNFTLRWESIQGLREVSLFKGGASSDYAYIKVKTK